MPRMCFFENVDGHISLGLREVIEDLESLGYSTTWGVFSAVEAGAPHQRKRVYILAHAKRDFIRQQSRWRSGENGQSTPFSGIDGEAQPLANADSEQPRLDSELVEDTQRQTISGTKPSWRGTGVANSDSAGLQRCGKAGNTGSKKQKPDEPQLAGCSTVSVGSWPPEPGLGRVVDGCPDRVDRIRLLGNGVVPQTAAKAWVVLNNQL